MANNVSEILEKHKLNKRSNPFPVGKKIVSEVQQLQMMGLDVSNKSLEDSDIAGDLTTNEEGDGLFRNNSHDRLRLLIEAKERNKKIAKSIGGFNQFTQKPPSFGTFIEGKVEFHESDESMDISENNSSLQKTFEVFSNKETVTEKAPRQPLNLTIEMFNDSQVFSDQDDSAHFYIVESDENQSKNSSPETQKRNQTITISPTSAQISAPITNSENVTRVTSKASIQETPKGRVKRPVLVDISSSIESFPSAYIDLAALSEQDFTPRRNRDTSVKITQQPKSILQKHFFNKSSQVEDSDERLTESMEEPVDESTANKDLKSGLRPRNLPLRLCRTSSSGDSSTENPITYSLEEIEEEEDSTNVFSDQESMDEPVTSLSPQFKQYQNDSSDSDQEDMDESETSFPPQLNSSQNDNIDSDQENMDLQQTPSPQLFQNNRSDDDYSQENVDDVQIPPQRPFPPKSRMPRKRADNSSRNEIPPSLPKRGKKTHIQRFANRVAGIPSVSESSIIEETKNGKVEFILKPRQLIVPQTPPVGLRRSQRTRVPTLRTWLGETAVYTLSGNRLTGTSRVVVTDPRFIKAKTTNPVKLIAKEQKKSKSKK